MRLYFFNLYDEFETFDEEGVWLANAEEAIDRAFQEARALAAAAVLGGHLTCHHRIEIVDENRNVIDTVRFDDAVRISP
ncbi:MAG: hypothetical protein ABW194_05395 [Novosphingobium sp.]